jgi:hypothetical protein
MAPLRLPPLAGVCSYTEAARPGQSVGRSTATLHRLAYVKQRLAIMAAAHLPSTPEWELKQALALHGWLDAEDAALLYQRIAELREPPPAPDDVPDETLERTMDEALAGATSAERIAGSYGVIRPWVRETIERYLADANPLCDQPSARILRIIHADEDRIAEWGHAALDAVRESPEAASADAWRTHIEAFLAGDRPAARARRPYRVDVVPRRDERFSGLYDTSTPADLVYLDERRAADERNAALLFKRVREMDVPEVIAGIVAERWAERCNALRLAQGALSPSTSSGLPAPVEGSPPKGTLAGGDARSQSLPWSYSVNMLRQMWDEARHSMLGEAALEARGIDWRALPVNVTFSYKLARHCTAVERHVLLYAIEQSLMPRARGKPYEHRVAAESGDALSALFHDFDWADEVLHVEIARRCLRPELPGGLQEARVRADALWQRISEALEREPLPRDARPVGDWWRGYARRLLGRDVEPVGSTHVKDWRPLSSA